MNKLKEHFKRHKNFYFGLAIGIGVAGITYAIMKEKPIGLPSGSMPELPSGSGPSIFVSGDSNHLAPIITTNVYNKGRGHPGYFVRCVESGEIFSSQKKAANFFGITESNLSSHLNGLFDDCNGLHFERISVN